MATGAVVSVLAATAALVQPNAGRALDARLTTRTGRLAGLPIIAAQGRQTALSGVTTPAAVRRVALPSAEGSWSVTSTRTCSLTDAQMLAIARSLGTG